MFSNLTNLYSLSKTLRFELKPVGRTCDLVDQPNFFSKDESKADAYTLLKEKMDKIHYEYINRCLSSIDSLPITEEMMNDFLNKQDTKAHFKLLR
jgi:CRISPR-associated protein Cpf1